jgi:hypothetical protein
MPDQSTVELPISEAPKSTSSSIEQSKPQQTKQAEKMIATIERKMAGSNINPDQILQEILNSASETAKPEEKMDTSTLIVSEQKYLQEKITENPNKFTGLEGRYRDKGSDSSEIKSAIDTYGKKAGLEHAQGIELAGKTFNSETRNQIGEQMQVQIDRLFNSEQGRKNPDKQASVAWETQRYLDLLLQAQAEGDIPSSIDASAVLGLVEKNVWQLGYQDRVASEIIMGDHGVRHLVDHNIKVTETIADSLQSQGQSVRAVDRLITHQIMLDHDLGYATNTVREGINSGEFGAENGHNLLSAKVIRQRMEDQKDPLTAVFSQKQLQILHEAILYHDDSKVDFRVGDESEEARRANIESAVHVADNTHVFENKLPELLYVYPDSLRVMRLLKTAGEIGDNALIGQLKSQLVESINNNGSFSADDKEALVKAAGSLSLEDYKFSVGRLCGNKPEYSIDSTGKLTIQVAESAIHQETAGLFDQKSYGQLRGFVSELTGKPKDQIDMNQDVIISANGKVEIHLKTGLAKATEQTDYQRQVEAFIAESTFQEFVLGSKASIGDAHLSRLQLNLEANLKSLEPGTNAYAIIAGEVSKIKEQRLRKVTDYIKIK